MGNMTNEMSKRQSSLSSPHHSAVHCNGRHLHTFSDPPPLSYSNSWTLSKETSFSLRDLSRVENCQGEIMAITARSFQEIGLLKWSVLNYTAIVKSPMIMRYHFDLSNALLWFHALETSASRAQLKEWSWFHETKAWNLKFWCQNPSKKLISLVWRRRKPRLYSCDDPWVEEPHQKKRSHKKTFPDA